MKISYHKRWDGNGTCYTQAISISKNILSRLQMNIQAELALCMPRKKEYISTSGNEIFLKPLYNHRIIFLNNTQTRFINLFLKLSLKNRNTCLLVA